MLPGFPPAGRLSVGRFTTGGLLLHTVSVWWRNAPAFAAVALVVQLPLAALELHAGETDDPLGSGLLPVFGWFLGLLASGALAHGVLRTLAGGRPGPGEMLATAARRLWPLFSVAALYGLTVVAGLFLLLVPGLVAMAGGYLAIPMVVEDPALGTERALRRSWALTQGHRVALVLAVAILLGLQLLAVVGTDQLITRAGVTQGPLAVGIATAVNAVLVSFTSSCAAVAYHDLRALREPRSQTAAKNPSVPWR